MKYLIGIDEVGRGPLAGPVAVGAVVVSDDFDWTSIEGVRDSKKLSEKVRERIYARAKELQGASGVRWAVCTSSAAYIDRYGIVPAINRALAEAISKLDIEPAQCTVLLDGGLKAPEVYVHQKTIIRGDDSEKVIALASILAKVTRDRLMSQLSKVHLGYDFESNKGYGTKAHCDAIAEFGLSKVHRASFCTRLRIGSKSV